MDFLKTLEEWYAIHCNGDWEHTYGVKIETLDNPGWSLKVDLLDTELSEANFEEVFVERSQEDWFRCWKANGSFNGVGGSQNLVEILTIFSQFITAGNDT